MFIGVFQSSPLPNAEVVRRWTDESRYIATRYQVVIVNEIDTVTTSAQDLMLSYLDGLGGKA